MASTPYTTAPGSASVSTLNYRNVWYNGSGAMFAPTNAQIDSSNARDTFNTSDVTVLEAGLLMGKITAASFANTNGTNVGMYSNSFYGLVSTAAPATNTTVYVASAVATEVARQITANAGSAINVKFIGPPSAAGTVATFTGTVSAGSGTSLTVTALGTALAAGSLIAPTNGAQTPITFVADSYGIPLTLTSGSLTNQYFSRMPIGGDVNTDMILGYSSMDTSVQTWVKQQLAAAGTGGDFTFKDNR